MGAAFWQQQCPARGSALTHVHSSKCAAEHTGHYIDQCCYCLGRATDPLTTTPPAPPPPPTPPLSVAARLRAIGLLGPEHDDDTPVEPKMATGEYGGPTWGIGRGELTDRQRKRLAFIDWLSRKDYK